MDFSTQCVSNVVLKLNSYVALVAAGATTHANPINSVTTATKHVTLLGHQGDL